MDLYYDGKKVDFSTERESNFILRVYISIYIRLESRSLA